MQAAERPQCRSDAGTDKVIHGGVTMEDTRDQIRTGTSTADLKQAILDNLYYVQGLVPELATPFDWYMALAYTVRDRAMNDWIKSFSRNRHDENIKIVAYLSAEFLIGPQLGNNLLNLGIHEQVRQAVSELGLDLDTLLRQEPEPGLGNGGLGRLAACYMDSLATLRIPAIGYGIRYEFGMFRQEIRDGWQVAGLRQSLGNLPAGDFLSRLGRRPHRAIPR